jgi:hypothetical protein
MAASNSSTGFDRQSGYWELGSANSAKSMLRTSF